MNFQEAFKAIDAQVFAKLGRHLSKAEKLVVEAAWEDRSYQDIAQGSSYNSPYLQHQVGPKLWLILSSILGNGTRITKKRLRSILEPMEERVAKPDYRSVDLLSLPETLDEKQLESSSTVLGGKPPDLSSFLGRAEELRTLKEWILKQQCVTLYGAVGIGKSVLTAKLIEEIRTAPQSEFDCLVWKSIAYAPSLSDLVTELTELINPLETELDLPEYTQAKVSVLLKQLRSRRCLLVLDAAEALLQGGNFEQRMEYGSFFLRLVEEQHQSCLVLISRMPFEELNLLIEDKRPIRSKQLEGLDLEAAMQLLFAKGLTEQEMCKELIQKYRGNPSELEVAVNRINHFFAGSTDKYMEYETTYISPRYKAMLNKQFGQAGLLSELQRQIMIYLAEQLEMASKPAQIEFTKLKDGLNQRQGVSVSTSELMTALEDLEKRSLVESGRNLVSKEISYSLEPVVKKYILTDPLRLVRKTSSAIQSA